MDELRAKVPPGVLQLAKVPGVGPKRALQLSRELGIGQRRRPRRGGARGQAARLSGFGAKSEERILRGIGVVGQRPALRDALRSLPADATEDEIDAVLAGHASADASSEQRCRPGGLIRVEGPPR